MDVSQIALLVILILFAAAVIGFIGVKFGVEMMKRTVDERISNSESRYIQALKDVREDYVERVNSLNGDIENKLSYKAHTMKQIYTDAYRDGRNDSMAEFEANMEAMRQKYALDSDGPKEFKST